MNTESPMVNYWYFKGGISKLKSQYPEHTQDIELKILRAQYCMLEKLIVRRYRELENELEDD